MLAATAAPLSADETFFCEDGSSVTIDNSNREAMRDHPCVKAWFVDDLARRQVGKDAEDKAARNGPKGAPVVHRYTVRRAMALRDLQQRPAYIAWMRSRTVEAGPAPRWTGTRRTHPRSLLNDKPIALNSKPIAVTDKPAAHTKSKSALRIRLRRR